MENRRDIVTTASAACVAAYIAIVLGGLTIYGLGLSRDLVRSAAVTAAILIAATLAIDHFGKKLGGTKKKRSGSKRLNSANLADQ
jgi:hypothetical protein